MPHKLRAILSQFEFSNTVKAWEAQGVPFCTRLYVPETHPITNDVFYEREDEGHVFKVHVCACTKTFTINAILPVERTSVKFFLQTVCDVLIVYVETYIHLTETVHGGVVPTNFDWKGLLRQCLTQLRK